MSRANEDAFDELHGLLTHELITRIKKGPATAADLKAAADWLSKNNVTGVLSKAAHWQVWPVSFPS